MARPPRSCSRARQSRTGNSIRRARHSPRRFGASAFARAIGSRSCCRTALSSLSPNSARGRPAPIVVAVNPTYTERELEQVLHSTRADTVVTLTPFYARVKAVQGRAGVKRVIATSIKEYLPPVLRLLFTLFKEAKEGHRITLAADDAWLQDLLDVTSQRTAARCQSEPGRSRSHPVERRHDRHAEGRGRPASALCGGGTAVVRVDQVSEAAMDRRHHAAAAALSRLRQRRRAAAGVRRTEPAVARAQSARYRRSAEDDQGR